VNGSKRNNPHDEKVERALRKVKPVVCFLHAYDFYISSSDVEGQGIFAVGMRSGPLSVRRIRKLGSDVTIKGKTLTKADLDPYERIGIGKRLSRPRWSAFHYRRGTFRGWSALETCFALLATIENKGSTRRF
jgi:hypothetical protein